MSASLLNGGDTYGVIAPGGQVAYLWKGAGSNEMEMQLGERLMETVCKVPNRVVMSEGEEPEEFWEALGGRADYVSEKDMGVMSGFDPRLMEVSNNTGYLWVQEVPSFVQQDLLNEIEDGEMSKEGQDAVKAYALARRIRTLPKGLEVMDKKLSPLEWLPMEGGKSRPSYPP